ESEALVDERIIGRKVELEARHDRIGVRTHRRAQYVLRSGGALLKLVGLQVAAAADVDFRPLGEVHLLRIDRDRFLRQRDATRAAAIDDRIARYPDRV